MKLFAMYITKYLVKITCFYKHINSKKKKTRNTLVNRDPSLIKYDDLSHLSNFNQKYT